MSYCVLDVVRERAVVSTSQCTLVYHATRSLTHAYDATRTLSDLVFVTLSLVNACCMYAYAYAVSVCRCCRL